MLVANNNNNNNDNNNIIITNEAKSTNISYNKQLMTVDQNSKRIKKEKKSKKNKIKMIKKLFAFVIPKLIEQDHKYLIRGDIIIDIKGIRNNDIYTHNNFDFKEFRPPRAVRYLKQNQFYEIEFGRIQKPIRDFSFIINMLESMGDQKVYYLAQQLKEYKNVYEMLDNLLELHRIEVDTSQEQKQNICSLNRPEKEGEWTYEMSLQKAANLIQQQYVDNKFIFYSVLKGNYDQYEVAIHGIKEQALTLIFGNMANAEMTKILLQNGLIMMNRSVIELLTQRIQANYQHLKGVYKESEYSSFTKDVTSYSINNYIIKLNIKFERYRLSSYEDRFNDYLVLGRVNDNQLLNLANQLFMQKVFFNPEGEIQKEILTDIGYSAQSEYLIEKYYTNANHSFENKTQKINNKKTSAKQCGYRLLESV